MLQKRIRKKELVPATSLREYSSYLQQISSEESLSAYFYRQCHSNKSQQVQIYSCSVRQHFSLSLYFFFFTKSNTKIKSASASSTNKEPSHSKKNNLGCVYLDYPSTNCTITAVKDRCLAHLCVKRVYTKPDRLSSSNTSPTRKQARNRSI